MEDTFNLQTPLTLRDIDVKFQEPQVKEEVGWETFRHKFVESLPNNARILEVGVGKGEDNQYFKDHGLRVVSANIESSDGLKSSSNPTVMDLSELGFAPDSFDGIWLGNVIIFVPDEKKRQTIRDCLRLLSKNGKLFICDNFFKSITFYDESMEKMFGDKYHTSAQLNRMVTSAGFEVVDEKIGIIIPEKMSFADEEEGFHTLLANKK